MGKNDDCGHADQCADAIDFMVDYISKRDYSWEDAFHFLKGVAQSASMGNFSREDYE